MPAYTWSANDSGITGQFAYGLFGALACGSMGGGALFGAWAVYQKTGLHPGIYILGSIAALMVGICIWLGVSAWSVYRRRSARARQLDQAPDRPWAVRDDWARGEVEAAGDTATVRLDAVPAVTGDAIRGQITGPDLDLESGETVRVNISCRVRTASGDVRTPWRDEADVQVQPHGSSGNLIRFSFTLPVDQPPATPDPEGRPRVDWRLQVHDDGWNGAVTFQLPVFTQSDGGADASSIDASGRSGTAQRASPLQFDQTHRAVEIDHLDDVDITQNGAFEAVIRGSSVRYRGARTMSVIVLLVLVAIHSYIGYMQSLSAISSDEMLGMWIAHGVVGLFTAFFLYKTLYPKGDVISVQVAEGRVRAAMSGKTFIDVPAEQVKGITVAVADMDRPRLGYDIRVDLDEPISLGGLSDALASIGQELDDFSTTPDAPDPRLHPPLYLAFETRKEADALAARIEEAVREHLSG
ncbi:hypothetical protein CRI94_09310 [Longibacter salinarum]|uniref:Uncharacterized protein n=1 Tax=Longibacter salinarum TaxID=1850348 RepID=A0A2A8CY27_9BACT|nr:hypothetical protein [Longibacter salinarum]PEN13504.1 hypothetical protein CRI94_09310 [Longibacter salinarum]